VLAGRRRLRVGRAVEAPAGALQRAAGAVQETKGCDAGRDGTAQPAAQREAGSGRADGGWHAARRLCAPLV
jgi:hypothetical protein